MILIDTYDQYQEAVAIGYEPLRDWRKFDVDIFLRVRIQRMIFGHRELTKADDIRRANDRFYRWCFEHSLKVCEETGVELHDYSSVHVSHILTKGAHPEMAHDPRNVNILTYKKHERWESGKNSGMKIYSLNMYIIELLKTDYSKLKV